MGQAVSAKPEIRVRQGVPGDVLMDGFSLIVRVRGYVRVDRSFDDVSSDPMQFGVAVDETEAVVVATEGVASAADLQLLGQASRGSGQLGCRLR